MWPAINCPPPPPNHEIRATSLVATVPVQQGAAMVSAQPAQILGFFWDLASVESLKRAEAAAQLIAALTETQAAHTAAGGAGSCADLEYALRRLVRGLASPRDGARQGFGAALVEVLAAFEAITPEQVLKLVEETLQLHCSLKGAEERDVLYGRVFACGSIIQSGRVASVDPPSRLSALGSTLTKELQSCGARRSFLQEVGATLLSQLISQLPPQLLTESVLPHLTDVLAQPVPNWTPHTLLLALRLGRRLEGEQAEFKRILPRCDIRDGALVHEGNMDAMLPALKGASCSHPRLHGVWNELIEVLCAGGEEMNEEVGKRESKRESKKDKKGKGALANPSNPSPNGSELLLRRFWRVIIEDGLIPSTLERKYMVRERLSFS